MQGLQALMHPTQGEVDTPSSVELHVVDARLELGYAASVSIELLLERGSLRATLLLALVEGFQGVGEGHQIIGEDTSFGISHDGLNGLCLLRNFRLAAQRCQLAANFAGEVV